VEVYTSEQEQVEALKKWWKENGRSIIAGVVIGLGAVFGWRAWMEHKLTEAEQASLLFQQVLAAAQSTEAQAAASRAEMLIADFDNTVYADFAALELARLALERGDTAAAESHLRWVLENSGDAGLQQIARLRLARVLASTGNLDQAWELARVEKEVASFAGEYAELRGDIALARGDDASARDFYQKALEKGAGDPGLIRMKMADLGVGTPTNDGS
jgi:predicted negative regulator of RcsB-dependent stress response